MVLSKRCKICSILDETNFPITNEYYDNKLPEVIRKITGIQLNDKKINAIYICAPCAVSIIQAANTVNRLQRIFSKLGKNMYSEILAVTSNASQTFQKFTEGGKNILNDSGSSQKARNKTSIENKKAKKSFTKNDSPQNTFIASEINDSSLIENDTQAKSDETSDKDCSLFPLLKGTINGVNNDVENNMEIRKKRKIESKNQDDTSNIHTFESSVEENPPKIRNCTICNKGFTEKSELKEHIDGVHKGEGLKKCQKCLMTFISLQKYEMHVLKNKCQDSPSHICSFADCKKKFASITKLQKHIQTNHSSDN